MPATQGSGAGELATGGQAPALPPLPAAGQRPGSGSGASGHLVAASSQLLRPASLLRQAAWHRSFATAASSTGSGSSSGSGDSGSSSGSGDSGSSEQRLMVKRRGKLVAVPPELAASLAPLAALCGGADVQALSRTVMQLNYVRQEQLPTCGPGVAAHLQRLGMEQPQLRRLLERCPLLFSWPAEQRVAVLFGQLAGLGRTAAEAARCFEQQPMAAGSPSFQATIEVLAGLLVSGSKDGQDGRQLLGGLLGKQPSALSLLMRSGDTLQRNADYLLVELGLSPRQLVTALRQYPSLLLRTPEHLADIEAMLQLELGVDRSLLAKLLSAAPRLAGCGRDTLQQRVRALVAVSREAFVQLSS